MTDGEFLLPAPLRSVDLPALADSLTRSLDGRRTEVVVCDAALVRADAVAVDAFARLALVARRHGARLQLDHVSAELRELIRLAGLEDVLLTGSG